MSTFRVASPARRRALRAVIAAGAALLALPAAASNTASGTANAEVVQPIAIAAVQTLEFGKLVAGTGGTVAVSVAGARTPSGGVIALASPAPRAATFTVTGDSGAAYTVTLPADGSVTLSDGALHTMAVDSFTSDTTGTITGGSVTLTVGATLTVGNGQAQGAYTGTFPVSVDYQ
ncbi:DUF4402 domain-containing protein [Anaeromyxobacter diazotrophicus]|uniref:DUF4402 domain-containing protein n=1 Tax=Anaeromyxobacter diazotrophicus TaxID=2590199 RepID=A0A7I9VLT3_9BACT|nr:DUF4402 domain-containing protein [Anaeromyxobacter diazotrophicus]GEJ57364.1 hypothetical protein AMYX_21050 [Anaeromyxobacter diazotrophicus]